MKLEPTRKEATYAIGDESGYYFKIVAEWFDEDGPPYRRGWSAKVVMESHGMKTAEAAIAALKDDAEAFLRQLKEVET